MRSNIRIVFVQNLRDQCANNGAYIITNAVTDTFSYTCVLRKDYGCMRCTRH